MSKQKKVLAWWFCRADKVLPRGDGRAVVEGATHRHDGELVLCKSGLHASKRLIDALRYAPGPVVCRVECGGAIVEGNDKLVCTSREYLHVVNVERELHEFAIWCAESALKAAKVTDERSWNALRVKRLWLDGKATDADLAAVHASAAASSDAARAACALAASAFAVHAAASAAAWDASAHAAAWDASASAAAAASASAAARGDAAWDAARAAQNRKLTSIINAKIKGSK